MWLYCKFWKVSLATTKRTYLAGNKINLITSRFTIPENRVLSIMESIQVTIKNLPYRTTQNLSKLCGKIISTNFVLGNIAQLKTRNIYKIIQAELTLDKRIRLHENDKAIQEIIFWRNNLIRLNSRVLYPYQVPTVLSIQTQIITPYPHSF